MMPSHIRLSPRSSPSRQVSDSASLAHLGCAGLSYLLPLEINKHIDTIPFPTAEPPTPPTTLTPDQQKAAKKAVGILNDEIEGQSTAQHLHDTLKQLRNLLHRDKLPE
jgi:hypothetical protein